MGARIQTLSEMLQQLAIDQLRALFFLLRNNILKIVNSVVGVPINSLPSLETLLEQFGTNLQVNAHIIETITDYFRSIHGNNLRLIPA